MILACPTCDSRYDVSGYPAGQKFRCRCGAVTALDAPSAEAALLACPHCGAGVSPAASTCAHCASELLVKACPRCLARVFHGHKHCPQCGAEVGVAAHGEATRLECPRCQSGLHARLVGDVLVDECPHCRGLFLDHVAIDRVIRDRHQARAEALVGALPRAELTTMVPPGGKMYLKCPTCRAVMNRRLFAAGSGVIVDVCRTHGTFFDAGELPAVIDFVMNGGLEAAQKKQLERQRDQLRRERDAVRDSQRDAARSRSHFTAGDTSGAAGALVDLLSVLFGA